MAQTKRKRRRKHRGTPAGTIDRAGRTGRPRTRQEAKQIARKRRSERMDRPPSWRASVNRAAIAAAIFGVVLAVPLHRGAAGAFLALFMFVLYIPLGYGTDLTIYRFRQRRKEAAGKK